MATLTAGVGDGGQNASHDVMLVQLALATVKTSKGLGYLPGAFNGVYDSRIAAAIRAFQRDHGLLKAGPAGASLEKEGLVKPASATMEKLLDALPSGLAAIRSGRCRRRCPSCLTPSCSTSTPPGSPASRRSPRQAVTTGLRLPGHRSSACAPKPLPGDHVPTTPTIAMGTSPRSARAPA